jgi:hypothetical protein
MFHLIIRNVPSAAVQMSRNLYRLILLYPELLNSGCPERAIPAAVAPSHTKLTAMGPGVAAAKADNKKNKSTKKYRKAIQKFCH